MGKVFFVFAVLIVLAAIYAAMPTPSAAQTGGLTKGEAEATRIMANAQAVAVNRQQALDAPTATPRPAPTATDTPVPVPTDTPVPPAPTVITVVVTQPVLPTAVQQVAAKPIDQSADPLSAKLERSVPYLFFSAIVVIVCGVAMRVAGRYGL